MRLSLRSVGRTTRSTTWARTDRVRAGSSPSPRDHWLWGLTISFLAAIRTTCAFFVLAYALSWWIWILYTFDIAFLGPIIVPKDFSWRQL